jgi:hypothetical protein
MNEPTDEEQKARQDEQTMARLLRLAGPRPPVPADIEDRVYARVFEEWRNSSTQPEPARVYDTVHREWTKSTRRRLVRRWALPLALAASVALAVALLFEPGEPDAVVLPVGTVARVVHAGGGVLPDVGDEVFPGEVLETGAGDGVSLALADAVSLRMGENSRLEIVAAGHYRLDHGRLYADSGDFVYRDRNLHIETALGAVTDIGTQFMVLAGDERLEVAVREGRVDVVNDATTHIAVAGERLTMDAAGDATVVDIDAYDSDWAWAANLSPAFDIENKSLLDFLRWAARETGRELVFEDQELRMTAMRTDLHGSVAGFRPLEAVDSVLSTTSFRYRIEAGRIIVER